MLSWAEHEKSFITSGPESSFKENGYTFEEGNSVQIVLSPFQKRICSKREKKSTHPRPTPGVNSFLLFV